MTGEGVNVAELRDQALEAMATCETWLANPDLTDEQRDYYVTFRNASYSVVTLAGACLELGRAYVHVVGNPPGYTVGPRRRRIERDAAGQMIGVVDQYYRPHPGVPAFCDVHISGDSQHPSRARGRENEKTPG